MNREKIAELNDQLRASIPNVAKNHGTCVVTQGVMAQSSEVIASVLLKVRDFCEFTEDNDSYGEHDFGAFEVYGMKFFWKIDYHDLNMEFASDDPADPAKTKRVLTIMLAEEY